MRSVERDPSRNALQFTELAKSAFAFLHELGFELVGEELTRLRYESPTMFVHVYHARGGYDLGYEIGFNAEPDDFLSEDEIEIASGGADEEVLRPQTLAQMRIDVPELARRLKAYGGPALAGDRAIWEAAARRSVEYTNRFKRPVSPPSS